VYLLTGASDYLIGIDIYQDVKQFFWHIRYYFTRIFIRCSRDNKVCAIHVKAHTQKLNGCIIVYSLFNYLGLLFVFKITLLQQLRSERKRKVYTVKTWTIVGQCVKAGNVVKSKHKQLAG